MLAGLEIYRGQDSCSIGNNVYTNIAEHADWIRDVIKSKNDNCDDIPVPPFIPKIRNKNRKEEETQTIGETKKIIEE